MNKVAHENSPGFIVGASNAANAGYYRDSATQLMESANYSHVTIIPEILPASDYSEPDNLDYSPANFAERTRWLDRQASDCGLSLYTTDYDDMNPRADRRQLGITIDKNVERYVTDLQVVRFGGRNVWQFMLDKALLGAEIAFAGIHAPDRPAADRAAFVDDLIAFSREYPRAVIAGDINSNADRTLTSRLLQVAGSAARLIPQTEPETLENNSLTLGRISHLLRKGGEIASGVDHERLIAEGLKPAAFSKPTMKLLGRIPLTPDNIYTKGLRQSYPGVLRTTYADHRAVQVTVTLR